VQAFVRGCEPEPFRGLQGPEGLFRALWGRHHVSRRRCETVAPQEFPRTCPLNRPRRCAGSNLLPPLAGSQLLPRALAASRGAVGGEFGRCPFGISQGGLYHASTPVGSKPESATMRAAAGFGAAG
jgi:hypothetical protein